MAVRIPFFCLIFLIAGLSGVWLAPAAIGSEVFSARACAKIYQRVRYIESDIKSYRAAMKIVSRQLKPIRGKLKAIQVKRRKLSCIYPSRLERSAIRTCTRFTKQRMKLLRQRDRLQNKHSVASKKRNALNRKWSRLVKIQRSCHFARRERSRKIIAREARRNAPRARRRTPAYHSRYDSAFAAAVVGGVAAAIRNRTIRRRPRGGIAGPGKCHRNPRTGEIDCTSF
ncbi:MAG: hypothetical protein ACTSY1_08215 [Alphaproteobacteria bacterium]